MSKTGCGFQRAEDRHAPEWFCVVHQCWSSTPDLCPLQRAEAAIERVRELHHLTVDTVDCGEGGVEDVEHCAECGHIYVDDGGCPTIRALDVPCPTCSGPIRETVGLVCQTCGTDYGASDE